MGNRNEKLKINTANKERPLCNRLKSGVEKKLSATIRDEKLRALCLELSTLLQQPDSMGIFTSYCDLLNCTHCGLQEHVLFNGKLVSYQAEASSAVDSDLRLIEADGDSFICPQCRSALTSAEP